MKAVRFFTILLIELVLLILPAPFIMQMLIWWGLEEQASLSVTSIVWPFIWMIANFQLYRWRTYRSFLKNRRYS